MKKAKNKFHNNIRLAQQATQGEKKRYNPEDAVRLLTEIRRRRSYKIPDKFKQTLKKAEAPVIDHIPNTETKLANTTPITLPSKCSKPSPAVNALMTIKTNAVPNTELSLAQVTKPNSNNRSVYGPITRGKRYTLNKVSSKRKSQRKTRKLRR